MCDKCGDEFETVIRLDVLRTKGGSLAGRCIGECSPYESKYVAMILRELAEEIETQGARPSMHTSS